MTMRADDNQEKRDLAGDYLRRARRKNILLAVLLLVLLVAAIWAACLGVAQLTPDRMIVTWLPSFSGMFKGVASLDAKEQNVLLMLRLPRIAAAVIAGAGWGIAVPVCGYYQETRWPAPLLPVFPVQQLLERLL